jgi:enterochelin esterase-like enzyme
MGVVTSRTDMPDVRLSAVRTRICGLGAVFCIAAILILFISRTSPAGPRPSALTGAQSGECPEFGQFLDNVAVAPDSEAKSKVVDEYLACIQRHDTPVMEKGTKQGFGRAIFLYRGNASLVALAGDMNGWTPNEAFTQVSGTDLFYLSREYEMDAALAYQIVLNDKDRIVDPLNSRKMPEHLHMNSYFTMPGYVLPPELEPGPSLRHGTVEDFSFSSESIGGELTAKVYLPFVYNGSKERYRTLYVWDGFAYLRDAKINEIVDAMIQRDEIPPILMVLVAPPEEYSRLVDLGAVVAKELVPAFDAKYRTRTDSASRAFLGDRLAVAICGQHSDIFARCAMQSAILFDLNYEKVLTAPKSDVRFHIDVGTYETNPPKFDVLAENRQMRDLLEARGYTVDYREVHEGDNWGNWPSRIPEILRFFWATPKKGK